MTSKFKFLANTFSVALVFLMVSCQPKTEYPITADLSKKKLTVEEAKELSELFIKDVEHLFTAADSLEYYKRLVDEFQNKRGVAQSQQALGSLPEGKGKFKLSASSWYSLDELQSYINESKKKADSLGYTLEGFRIYIGVFPNQERFGDKRNFLTTFITPTGSESKQQGSFFTRQTVSKDLTGISPLEYGQGGWPPNATYPQQ